MIAAAVAITAVWAYLLVGWLIMRWDMPALWERARGRSSGRKASDEVRNGAWGTMAFWPLRLPWLLAAHSADRLDPKRIEAELEAQRERIQELERELQMGGGER